MCISLVCKNWIYFYAAAVAEPLKGKTKNRPGRSQAPVRAVFCFCF